jgi:hypothetical protein
MRRKKAEETQQGGIELPGKHGGSIAEVAKATPIIPVAPIPATTGEGVIDLDPSPNAPNAEVNSKPRRKYTKRAKTAVPPVGSLLVNVNLIYEKAVEAFRAYFNNEQSREVFESRVADLKALQSLAEKLAQK